MTRWTQAATALALLGAVRAADAQVRQRATLTIDGAKRILAAAEAEAARQNFPSSIAIVDDGGNPLLLTRVGDWTTASARVAIGKARTAATFRRATGAFEEIIKNGRTAMVALDDFTPLQGGVPIVYDGTVIGAIGVSGSNPPKDEEIAMAGLKALAPGGAASNGTANGARNGDGAAASAVAYFPGAQVRASFSRGAVLYDGVGRNYMVHTSRRTGSGMAEVHAQDTDVIYVQGGTATLVTGGTVVDGQDTAPGEVRGARIASGARRALAKGDVVIVPNGTPHQFEDVRAPFTYYVVKVR